MMQGANDGCSRIMCPYFKRKVGKTLTCDGFVPGVNVNLVFEAPGAQNEYMESFCMTRCWQGCVVAQLAEDKYEQ